MIAQSAAARIVGPPVSRGPYTSVSHDVTFMTCDRLNPSSSMRAIAAESTRSARTAARTAEGDCAAAGSERAATSAADESVAACATRRTDGVRERTSGVLDEGDVSCTRRALAALSPARNAAARNAAARNAAARIGYRLGHDASPSLTALPASLSERGAARDGVRGGVRRLPFAAERAQ